MSVFRYGNEAIYTLARLDRDNPALAERVRAGELSANAAAIEAGWRKKSSSLKQICRLLLELTPEEWIILTDKLRRGRSALALEEIRRLLPKLTLEEHAVLADELRDRRLCLSGPVQDPLHLDG